MSKNSKYFLSYHLFYPLENSKFKIICEYKTNKQPKAVISKYTKEIPISSQTINFDNELLKFTNIDISNSYINFNSIINGKNNGENAKLLLSTIGIKRNPIEKSLKSADLELKISIIINKLTDLNQKIDLLPKKKEEEAPKTFQDKRKMFSGGNNISKTDKSTETKEKEIEPKISLNNPPKIENVKVNKEKEKKNEEKEKNVSQCPKPVQIRPKMDSNNDQEKNKTSDNNYTKIQSNAKNKTKIFEKKPTADNYASKFKKNVKIRRKMGKRKIIIFSGKAQIFN